MQKLQPFGTCPKVKLNKVWEYEDDSVSIFPKKPDGTTIKVTIGREHLHLSINGKPAMVFSCIATSRKTSWKVTYGYTSKPVDVGKVKFIKEVIRLGGVEHLENFSFITGP